MKKLKIYLAAVLFVAFMNGCDEEYTNPSTINAADVFSTKDGLIAALVGVQVKWSEGRLSPVYNSIAGAGLSTGGLFVINVGNLAEAELELGGDDVIPDNRVVSNLWEQSLLSRHQAQQVLDNIEVVSDPEIVAGIEVYALIFKALCNGTLVQFYEQVPLTIQDDAPFSDRAAVLDEAISDLEQARNLLNTATISEEFYSQIPNTIDFENTINALLARFHLFNGDYQAAITAANRVDLSVMSVFGYDDLNLNPVATQILDNNNFQPRDLDLGLSGELTPDPNDERIEFYVSTDSTYRKFNDTDSALAAFGEAFFNDFTEPIPVYLPGEILLIKAEAYARQDLLTEAVTELDAVLTKTAEQDAYGIGANLPAYGGPLTADAILTEIFKNRSIELFMTGLNLEDSRRFGRPGPNETGAERNRNFYPYPRSERNNNTNTPSDPAI